MRFWTEWARIDDAGGIGSAQVANLSSELWGGGLGLAVLGLGALGLGLLAFVSPAVKPRSDDE